MDAFDDRQKAYEDKFAHDEELRFKATVRAAKLFGEWAAEQIGLSTDIYAAELINLVTGGKGEEEILKKVAVDAQNKGKKLSQEMLAEKHAQCVTLARQQVLAR